MANKVMWHAVFFQLHNLFFPSARLLFDALLIVIRSISKAFNNNKKLVVMYVVFASKLQNFLTSLFEHHGTRT